MRLNPTSSSRRRPAQSGYAMLLVFAMSAIVAIGLYQQLPRAAFEAQRTKEQLLIDHGEQYRRAVQLYCRKMGRYPAKMEDLDNTQNLRFLRKHYIDPMTGKEEWRLLHMGPNGKLIDSKIEALTKPDDQWHAGSITEFKSPASSSADDGPEAVNLAARKRPSDDQNLGPLGGNGPAAPANTDPAALPLSSGQNPGAGTLNNGSSIPPGTPGAPQPPGMTPGAPAWVNGGALPGMPAGMRNLTAPGGVPNAQGNPNNSNASTGAGASVSGNGGFGSSISGNGGFGSSSASTPAPSATGNGAPVNSQYQGQSPTTYPTAQGSNMPGAGGFGNPGFNTGGANSPAQMINGLLTSPRPGGAPSGAMPGIGGTVVGGLAGVASTHRGHGIKRYADQDEYQKWEFYYDFSKEMQGNVGTINNIPMNTNPAGTTGGTIVPQPSPQPMQMAPPPPPPPPPQ